ncbi:hypothetical protein [Brevundimonas sp. SPF441]|uniref:hypothetical protein n=1 Tax=Brevundimonas sp. SPF441 TaxID=2663795 RepID=UPI00129EE627|nr:hypothetical protein [Brevundimonas sp. SPF441]MRL69789.1 hypothetical protein [Brevundimonas sp. SPF441]
MPFSQATIGRTCGETITTTTETTSINQRVQEVHLTRNGSEIVLAILPADRGDIGGASIALSPEQAQAVADRLSGATA